MNKPRLMELRNWGTSLLKTNYHHDNGFSLNLKIFLVDGNGCGPVEISTRGHYVVTIEKELI